MIRHLSLSALALTLATTASAQEPIEFTIDTPASQWTWTGTWSLPPLSGSLVSNGPNTFELTGNFYIELLPGAHPIATGQFVSGGSAAVQPDLSGTAPNPLPLLPPIATADLTSLTFDFTSPPFAIDPAGNFTADVTMTVLSGNLTVTPSGSAPTITDLTGIVGNPVSVSGNIFQSNLDLSITSPQTGQIVFTDQTTGVTGDVTLVGTLAGDHTCPAPVSSCPGTLNSTGSAATISMLGSTRLQDDDLTLVASDLPPSQFAFFLASRSPGLVVSPGGSQGDLCLGFPFARFAALVGPADATGVYDIDVDLGAIPLTPTEAVLPGETWYFQCWHRDVNPTVTSNLTDVIAITFCP